MAETYTVYFGTSLDSLSPVAEGISDLTCSVPNIPLSYNTVYYWRVDATNEYGTTTGDTWLFYSLDFDPPLPTVHIIDGGDPPDFSFGDGVNHTPESDPPGTGGVEGTDWEFVGTNGAFARKMVILAANNKVWIEDI